MHVVVNTRLLLPTGLDGIGWFTHETLRRITQELPDWKFTFLFDRRFDPKFIYGPNVEGKVLTPPARHPLLYLAYFEWSVANYLNSVKPDLFFSPDGFLSLRSSVPQVPVIHDINFEHRPQDLPKAYRVYYRKMFPRFARKAEHIITVSEYSRQDISRTYGIDDNRITVAYNGANSLYHPISDDDKQSSRQRFAEGSPYWIFIGNFSYRKNIHGIIKAFDAYRVAGGLSHLVLVGNPLWQYHEMKESLKRSRFRKEIHLVGHLSPDDLKFALGGANGLLFPSFFEGFGIPVIEAFQAGVPVITSNQTSLPEVAGEAGIITDPEDFLEISKAMHKIESDENQRDRMIREGFLQASKFSWDKCANKVKSVMFSMVTESKEAKFS